VRDIDHPILSDVIKLMTKGIALVCEEACQARRTNPKARLNAALIPEIRTILKAIEVIHALPKGGPTGGQRKRRAA
jgi:hypothetical protein